MFLKAMQELRGDEVLARDGRIGALDDIYFDGECWQVRYLVVATGADRRKPRVLISVACVAKAAQDRVLVELSRAQVELGAGAWPIESALGWLDGTRVCSGRELIGLPIEAEDGPAGRVVDLLVDEMHWSIDYLVADAAGGKQVLMPLDWVSAIDFERGAVQMRRTREELRSAPPLG